MSDEANGVLSVSAVNSERRIKPRVKASFPALVRGRIADHRTFAEETHVENISANGLYLPLRTPVGAGSRVFAFVFMNSKPEETTRPTIAVLGTVVRAELLADGSSGIALRVNRYRLL